MTISLSPEVRARLDAHLDAVERALVDAGSSREHRRGVVDDLEAQILDMLAGRSESPTSADLDAVLAGLDPPAAYGDSAGPPASPAAAKDGGPRMQETFAAVFPPAAPTPPRPRYSRTAIWGLVFILLSFIPIPVLAVVGFFLVEQTPHYAEVQRTVAPAGVPSLPAGVEGSPAQDGGGPSTQPAYQSVERGTRAGFLAPCMAITLFPLGLTGTLLGCIALAQIRASRGILLGKGLALFDALFYPCVILLILAIGLIHDLI